MAGLHSESKLRPLTQTLVSCKSLFSIVNCYIAVVFWHYAEEYDYFNDKVGEVFLVGTA